MNNQYGEENPFCYFHPREKLVGVCAHCLKEKLLYLASKQGSGTSTRTTHSRKSSLSIPKIFALGSFLHRTHQTKSQDFDQDASTSQEDSFISIKFEDNGIASWDKGANSKVPLKPSGNKHTNSKPNNGAVIEHVKSHVSSMWWRKRVGQIFQLVRWKGSSKANVCHVSNKVGGVKVRKGWMRSLKKKKKRTME